MIRIIAGNDDQDRPLVWGNGRLLLASIEECCLLHGVPNENRYVKFLLSGKRPSSLRLGALLPLVIELLVKMHQQGGNVSGGESVDFRILLGNVCHEELENCHLVQLSRLVGAAVDHLERLFFCGVRIRSHQELLGESEQILDGEGEGGY